MKTLARQAPLPSKLILIARPASTLMNSVQVNWLPRWVLKLSGLPWRANASPTASMQESVASAINTCQDRTRRVNQSGVIVASELNADAFTKWESTGESRASINNRDWLHEPE